MVMRPRCSSIRDLVRARPRPVPCVVLECWPSTCSKGWARRSRSAALMPMPVSVTETRTLSASWGATVTVTAPPSGVNFTALEIRFSITCFRPR
ncbi:hypothetical protein D3C81_1797300 [compost metagenome]